MNQPIIATLLHAEIIIDQAIRPYYSKLAKFTSLVQNWQCTKICTLLSRVSRFISIIGFCFMFYRLVVMPSSLSSSSHHHLSYIIITPPINDFNLLCFHHVHPHHQRHVCIMTSSLRTTSYLAV